MIDRLLVAAVAFVIGLPLTVGALVIGTRAGLLDVPSAIKPHSRPIPYTGGTAIAAVIVVAAILTGQLPLALIGAAVWLIGFVDDLRSLPPVVKLLLEVLLLLLWAIAQPLSFPESMLAVAAGVVLINAFNVIDGLDGLAAGCALAPLIVLATFDGAAGLISAAAVGSVAAFLMFNRHPARVFLGDEGSLVLGSFIWALPLVAGMGFATPKEALLWALLWLFPLVNAAFVVVYRVRTGRPIMRGDRSHLYDFWHKRFGLSKTLIGCWTIAIVGALGALLAREL
ncbi:MAG: undecaprenyl/decaprenyl-phosphate alpha-N-acetylglucosaminyl 1-phosphate transferase [Actinomycetota bacterium]|nr:undecaprenyl/decaprenyl-phosphate alpha-N-acetylglucosaminyl 1-phosphate transferase [Actinomycetota bacterium]